ncbi:putative methyltransferase [Chondrocystis sp. NIES-4102]|nr:putative methyltransferase [Chondrocystis sp. NIES-4102]
MTDSTEVKQFYDDFTASRMLEYRLYGNLRIEQAIQLINNYINSDSNILDLGCGIGIVAEQMANKLSQGKILACDLSQNNINYARRTIKSDKIEFLNVDIVKNFATIRERLISPVDLVTMVDVIEHLPNYSYEQLFNNLSQITSDRAKLIFTYPSPEYQLYLREYQPQELQIIDEVIELQMLLQYALKYGFNLEYFTYLDIWRENQYIHCVFSKQRSCFSEAKPSSMVKFQRQLKYYQLRLLSPFIKAKYKNL